MVLKRPVPILSVWRNLAPHFDPAATGSRQAPGKQMRAQPRVEAGGRQAGGSYGRYIPTRVLNPP